MAEAPQTSEQKFTNKLLEILESSKTSVIWTRVKYEEIFEKIKSGRKKTAKTTSTCRGKCFPLIIIMIMTTL